MDAIIGWFILVLFFSIIPVALVAAIIRVKRDNAMDEELAYRKSQRPTTAPKVKRGSYSGRTVRPGDD